tara:strand:- start:297 stop:872 length:576 start_codon:yes stop_codon:yes gene_type:complete
MITVFGEQKFRPCIKYQTIIPGYFVSRIGEVYSSHSNKLLSPGPSYRGKDNQNLGKYTVSLAFPKGLFDDIRDGYEYNTSGSSTDKVSCSVHQLVAQAWLPLDENPPASLADDWNRVITPDMVGQPLMGENMKQWVRDTAVVDHIDDNPANNVVENLRWVTPIENSNHLKEHDRTKISGERSENTIDGGDA